VITGSSFQIAVLLQVVGQSNRGLAFKGQYGARTRRPRSLIFLHKILQNQLALLQLSETLKLSQNVVWP
jgi:hypothetical protein